MLPDIAPSLTFDCDHLNQHNLPLSGGVYAAKVVIMRTSLGEGHAYHNFTSPNDLDYISVLTVASSRSHTAASQALKEKRRYILRLAARKCHRRLILSMPYSALMVPFKEIAAGSEFRGGWFDGVVIAVFNEGLDIVDGKGVYEIMRDKLCRFFF